MKEKEIGKKFRLHGHQKFILAAGVLAFILLAIVTAFLIYLKHINEFNEETRLVAFGDTEQPVSFDIYPRGGATDAWEKDFKGVGLVMKQNALIYDAVVSNDSIYEVSDWSIHINVPKKCFLNNGWCGTFDITQTSKETGETRTQTIDLQDPVIDEIILDYVTVDQDLMIPLREGDTLVYNPNREVNEAPLLAKAIGSDEQSTVTVGFIIYYSGIKLRFSDAYLEYHLYKKPFDDKESGIFISLAALWFFAFAIYISLLIYNRVVAKKMKQSSMMINNAMSVFTGFFEAKDSYTRGHSKRVADYSRMLAKECGLSDSELQTVYYIAYMHDCGKCYIPDTILKKEGRLDDEEFEVIKSHTVKGAEMVRDFTAIKGLQDGVRHHHERYDGKGYPDGLKGDEIPFIARVICIADSYDAMSSDRCYRKKLDTETILSEFERCKGKQFDPELTDMFVEVIKKQLS